MSNSTHWSGASASCRLEWTPSRWLLLAQFVLVALVWMALALSAMPAVFAWLLAALVLGWGGASARREWRRAPREFVFRGPELPVLLDGRPVSEFSVQWRGPLAFARWRGADGRAGHASWWPDTLPAARRRELRLATGGARASRHGSAMAP